MIKPSAAFLVALVAFAPATAADYFSANKLREHCSDRDPGFVFGCQKYIQGYIDGIQAAGDGRKNKKDGIWCFPREGTLGQAVLVVQKFVHDNPELLHQEAALIVGIALVRAFPCKKSN